jgi:hypothetical protein
MKNSTLLFIALVVSAPLSYYGVLTYEKTSHFPKHLELSAVGGVLGIVDRSIRQSKEDDPGYFYSEAMSAIQDDDALFKRTWARAMQLKDKIEVPYSLVLQREIERRSKLCLDAMNRKAPASTTKGLCDIRSFLAS